MQSFKKTSTLSDLISVGSDSREIYDFLLELNIDADNFQNAPAPIGAVDHIIRGDGQFDNFSYMLPTSSGNFIIKNRKNMIVALMDEKQNVINICREECKITDASGIEYFPGGSSNGVDLNEKEQLST